MSYLSPVEIRGALLLLLGLLGCSHGAGSQDDGGIQVTTEAVEPAAQIEEEPAPSPAETSLPDPHVSLPPDADKYNDGYWLSGAMLREDAREHLVERLLRDDGYQGENGVRQLLLTDATALLEREPRNPTAMIIQAMLILPTDGLNGPDGEMLPASLQAIKGLEAAITADPRRADAMIQLAELYEVLDSSKANDLWEQAIEHVPHDLDVRNHLGEGYTKTGQFEEARKVGIKTIELAGAMGTEAQLRKARNIVGTSLTHLGRYEEAEKYLKLALLNRDGSHWNCAYQALGVLYSKVGTVHDNPFDPFEELQPDDNDANANFSAALRYYYAHRTKESLNFINRALTLQRTAHFLVVKGFMTMAQKDYEGASRLFDEAKSLAQGDHGPDIGQGHLAIVKQEYGRAHKLLKPALDKWLETDVSAAPDPDYYHFMHRMGCLGMGWLHANQDQHDLAIKYFDRVLAHRPYDLLARLGKGNSLMGLQLMDQAETELQGVLDLDPDNPYAKAELASIHLSRGDVTQAEQGFQAALAAHDQGYTCPYEGLGMVYLRQGKIDKARKNFEKAISLNPDIEYKKFNGLARIYIQEGRTAEARKLLRKSIANYPYDDEAKKLLEELEK